MGQLLYITSVLYYNSTIIQYGRYFRYGPIDNIENMCPIVSPYYTEVNNVSHYQDIKLQNYSLVACVGRERRPRVDSSGGCSIGRRLQMNTTNIDHFSASVLLPYPEAGLWFVTLRPFCFHTPSWWVEHRTLSVHSIKFPKLNLIN